MIIPTRQRLASYAPPPPREWVGVAAVRDPGAMADPLESAEAVAEQAAGWAECGALHAGSLGPRPAWTRGKRTYRSRQSQFIFLNGVS